MIDNALGVSLNNPTINLGAVALTRDTAGSLFGLPLTTSASTTQPAFTQINAIGLGYYPTYDYLPGRSILLKAHVAHTYGSSSDADL